MPYAIVSTGSSYYDNVRPLAYPDSDAVLICFDISRPETLDSVIKKVSVRFISSHPLSAMDQHLISFSPDQHLVSAQISVPSACIFTAQQQCKSAQGLEPFSPLSHQNLHAYLTLVPPRNGRSELRMRGDASQPGGFRRKIRYAN